MKQKDTWEVAVGLQAAFQEMKEVFSSLSTPLLQTPPLNHLPIYRFRVKVVPDSQHSKWIIKKKKKKKLILAAASGILWPTFPVHRKMWQTSGFALEPGVCVIHLQDSDFGVSPVEHGWIAPPGLSRHVWQSHQNSSHAGPLAPEKDLLWHNWLVKL